MIAVQLVIEEAAEWFAFQLGLTRAGIYSDLLARERRLLRRSTDTLERLYSEGKARDVYLADLAYHFFEAGVWEKMLTCARRAGERTQRLMPWARPSSIAAEH
jgi:hypothetical protein